MNDELDVENGEIMISIPATADVAVGAQSTSRSGMPDYSPHKKACHSYAVSTRIFREAQPQRRCVPKILLSIIPASTT